jgi:hypothetical protein
VVRKTSGPKREEVEDLMKLHNEELNDTQYSLNIILVVKQRVVERRGAYRVWWRNLKVKALLERPRRRCEDNVVVYVKKIVLEGVRWINLAENRAGSGLL